MNHYAQLAEASLLARSSDCRDQIRAVALARAAAFDPACDWWQLTEDDGASSCFYLFGEITDADRLLEELAARGHQQITLKFDSPGGDTRAALEIGSFIATRGNITGLVTARCASAANFILAGCAHRLAAQDSELLIHSVRAACCDNSKGLRETAQRLDSTVDEASHFLASRTGQCPALTHAWLTGPDLYFTAQQAKAVGLIHQIAPPGAPVARSGAGTPIADTVAMELVHALRGLPVRDKAPLRQVLASWLAEATS